jgi:beta-galactosidase
MYRDVQLLFKDSVYVPRGGLRTATTGTVASPTVHAVTIVTNESKAAKSVTVAVTVRNSTGASVASQTSTQSVPASGTSNFDMTTGAVASPLLWSPSSPNLYSLKTVVSVAGTVVDSVVESIGLRFYTWSNATPGGLSVNGVRTEIKGVCLAQFMGWVENAIPDSRHAKMVAILKAMGVNGIRCSHYPRSESFYHACDSLGVLVLCELPTWGYGYTYNNLPIYWTNMYGADSAMVLDAYNHPSIWGWSLFNEPTDNNMGSMITRCDTIIKDIEAVAPTGRVTLVANPFGGSTYLLDIHGENYSLTTSTALPVVNTEEYENWNRDFVRGNAMDLDVSSTSEAAKEWSDMSNSWSTSDKCAGAHFWCFMDYCSFGNQVGRAGVVDRFYIPKNVYFMFQKNLLGTTPDYWTNGTATKIDCAADQTTLRADGTDLCQITATLRNANNQCVQQNCVLTFTASPTTSITALYSEESANPMSGNSVTVTVEGGRAGILVRANRTPGNIVVTATNSCGLPSATVNLTSTAVSETIPALSWNAVSAERPGTLLQSGNAPLRLKTVYTPKGIALSFPSGVDKTVRIIDCRGKTVAAFTLKNGVPALVDHGVMGSGVFYAAWDDQGGHMLTRLNMVR